MRGERAADRSSAAPVVAPAVVAPAAVVAALGWRRRRRRGPWGGGGRPRTGRPWEAGPLCAAAVVAVAVVAAPRVPVVSAVAGAWLAVALPAQLLYVKITPPFLPRSERIALAVAAAVLLDTLVGLGLNTALPLVGVSEPLARTPVLVASACVAAVLLAWRPGRDPRPPPLGRGRKLAKPDAADRVVRGLCALVLVLAVAGANRLNNGATGSVTLLMLVVAAALVCLLLRWRHRLAPASICGAVYCVALALLFMTSLRGWYITGHDSQRELRVFQLTKDHARWSMQRFPDAYNACLSITVLPTVFSRLTRVADPYVYKLLFQLIFAYVPVVVYRISARVTTPGVALLAAVYFVSFPTYFTDLPFLNRQEIAFLFVAVSVLLVVQTEVPVPVRRRWLRAFSVGLVVSHYSTTYVFIAVLAIALSSGLTARWAARLARDVRARRAPAGPDLAGPDSAGPEPAGPDPAGPGPAGRAPAGHRPPVVNRHPTGLVGLGGLAFITAVALVWNGPITHAGGNIAGTLTASVRSLLHGNDGDETSSDVSYGILSGGRKDPADRLRSYGARTRRDTRTARANGEYYPLGLLDRYPTPVVPAAQLPLTGVGRLARDAGIPVPALHAAVRQGAARLLQVFACVGLIVAGGRRWRIGGELTALGFASMTVLAAQIALPGLTVDYGLLRAFQQALVVLAPVLAVGSVTVFRWLGRRAAAAAAVVAVGLFLSLTGVLPQLTGGYPPQLHLNDSGLYYDIYHVSPAERAALLWARSHRLPESSGGMQSEVESDRFEASPEGAFSGVRTIDDIYPAMLRRGSYVFLGTATVRAGTATLSYAGDLITYRYPTRLLDGTKSLVYSCGEAAIYR